MPGATLGPADTVGQGVALPLDRPRASGIDKYTCSSNTLRSMPALAQGIMGTQKERSRPRVWGTEGFPEEVRLEPKLKRGYELTSPPLSEGSQ